jgi:hypothetical protein
MEGAPLRCLCRVAGCLGAAGRVRSARLWSLPRERAHKRAWVDGTSGSIAHVAWPAHGPRMIRWMCTTMARDLATKVYKATRRRCVRQPR